MPQNGSDLRQLIDSFDSSNGLCEKGFEVKFAAVAVQNVLEDVSPMCHFLSHPQSKNPNSRFNYVEVDAMMKVEVQLRDEG